MSSSPRWHLSSVLHHHAKFSFWTIKLVILLISILKKSLVSSASSSTVCHFRIAQSYQKDLSDNYIHESVHPSHSCSILTWKHLNCCHLFLAFPSVLKETARFSFSSLITPPTTHFPVSLICQNRHTIIIQSHTIQKHLISSSIGLLASTVLLASVFLHILPTAYQLLTFLFHYYPNRATIRTISNKSSILKLGHPALSRYIFTLSSLVCAWGEWTMLTLYSSWTRPTHHSLSRFVSKPNTKFDEFANV